MTERGLLIVLSGPSGVGKDTVLSLLREQRDDCVLSISATTRDPRPGETDGEDYFFITQEEFVRLKNAGDMLECAEYSGNCYATPARAVERLRAAGKHVILEIEVQGALQVREKCADAVLIFMMPPSMEVLRHRLTGRGTEAKDVVEERMRAARSEIARLGEYEYVIVNHCARESCRKLSAVITAAGCSVKRSINKLQEELTDA